MLFSRNNYFHYILLIAISAFLAFAQVANAETAETTANNSPLEPTPQLDWHSDYNSAYRQAKQENKFLLLNFFNKGCQCEQDDIDKIIAADAATLNKLQQMVLLRVPCNYKLPGEQNTQTLLSLAAFREMRNQPGIAIIDLQNQDQPYYGRVVSAFPYSTGKYYRWRAEYLPHIVNLPAGTLTQRSMVWAVRIHPESPASTNGTCDPQLASAAASHSNHQANIQQQGHHNWSSRFHQIRATVNAGEAKEVVAESWPNQTMIDSCIDCVASWRHSSGHWGAVRNRHRLYGYDIKQGRNGIWYGTGIFAN